MKKIIKAINRLSPEERTRVITELQSQRRSTSACFHSAEGAIPCIPREEEPRASIWQEQMWYLEQLTPGVPTYNVPFRFDLDGSLNLSALSLALGEIAHRHESLRTTLQLRDGRVIQIVSESVPHLEWADVSHFSDPELAASECAIEFASASPSLEHGPLYRTKILRLDHAGKRHVLLWVASHAIVDGWSVGIFVRELLALYGPLSRGERPNLPELPIQFVDYAAWQRQRLAGCEFAKLLEFWKMRLEGCEHLNFPTDLARPPSQSSRGATHCFLVPAETAGRLRDLSRRYGVTLFVTLLSVYKLLLAHHTGLRDIVVATAVSGRQRPELEQVIGSFVNTVVVRTDLTGELSAGELLVRVRESVLGALEHQEIPFGKLVEHLAPTRDPSRNPFCQTMFLLGSTPLLKEEMKLAPDLVLRWNGISTPGVKFDFELSMEESPEGLRGRFDYCLDLFRPETAKRLCAEYVELIETILDPYMCVSALLTSRNVAAVAKKTETTGTWKPLTEVPEEGQRGSAATEEWLAAIWAEELGVYRVGRSDDFFSLGGHSLMAAKVVARLRREADIDLTLGEFLQNTNVAALAVVVERLSKASHQVADMLSMLERIESMSEQKVGELLRGVAGEASISEARSVKLITRETNPMAIATTNWLLRSPNPEASTRLFCFPFAGIGASAYRLWAPLTDKLEVCPIQLPGRENRSGDEPYEYIEALANDLVEALLSYLDRPFAFFGHCMGALIAYETALRLQEHGLRSPYHLYISASRAPHSSHRGPLHASMSDIELASILQKRSAGIQDPEELSLVLPLSLPLLRKDLEMCDRYRRQPSLLGIPITTFAWRNDKGILAEELADWGACGSLSQYVVDGDHFEVQTGWRSVMDIIGRDVRSAVGVV